MDDLGAKWIILHVQIHKVFNVISMIATNIPIWLLSTQVNNILRWYKHKHMTFMRGHMPAYIKYISKTHD